MEWRCPWLSCLLAQMVFSALSSDQGQCITSNTEPQSSAQITPWPSILCFWKTFISTVLSCSFLTSGSRDSHPISIFFDYNPALHHPPSPSVLIPLWDHCAVCERETNTTQQVALRHLSEPLGRMGRTSQVFSPEHHPPQCGSTGNKRVTLFLYHKGPTWSSFCFLK